MKDIRLHELKCVQPYFEDIFSNRKNFDVRKNDRDFKIGDRVDFFEGDEEINEDTDVSKRGHCHRWIKYILQGGQFGIAEGYCVLGLTHVEILGNCKECGKMLTEDHNLLPEFPNIYECSRCGHPHTQDEIVPFE